MRSNRVDRTFFFSVVASITLHAIFLVVGKDAFKPIDYYARSPYLLVKILPPQSLRSVMSPIGTPIRQSQREGVRQQQGRTILSEQFEQAVAKDQLSVEDGFSPLLEEEAESSPYYFSIQEVDIPPYAVGNIAENSDALQGYLGEGRMVLNLWISEQGLVTKVEVPESNMPELVSDGVRLGFEQSSFVPAKRAGMSVNAWMRIEVEVSPPARIFPRKR